MGQAVGNEVNMEPPMTVEESAARVAERVRLSKEIWGCPTTWLTFALQIDALTPETSAKFLSYDGTELPW